MHYDVKNWYWVVAENPTQVYSSSGRAYVSLDDAVYVAWLAAGGKPTKIAQADLASVVNAPILAQISALEGTTLRHLRDVAGGKGSTASGADNLTPLQRLANAETAITALRATLL